MVEKDRPQPIRRQQPFSPSGIPDFPMDPLVKRISPQSPTSLIHKAPEIVKHRQAKKPIYGVENIGRQAIVVRFSNLLHADERIKYDPSNGDVYIGSWTRRVSKENPQSKPKRRWNNWGDIEKSIRGAIHIVEKHKEGGEAHAELKTVHDLSLSLFDKFSSGEITYENLTEHLEDAVAVLEKNHLIKPTVTNRQLMVRQIVSALNRDSLKRFNPLVSRTKLASATVKLIYELFIVSQTQQKYGLLLASILQVERETERFYIRQVLERSKELQVLEFGDFATDQSKAIWNLSISLLNPDLIKVAPYRKPAVMFVGYVFGFPEKFKDNWEGMFTKIFEKDNLEVIKFIHENSNQGDKESYEKFKERLSHGIQILEEALTLGEKNLKKES